MPVTPVRPNPVPRRHPPLGTAFLGILLAALLPLTAPRAGAHPGPLPDYPAWAEACRALPSNRALGGRLAPKRLLPLASYAEFAAVLDPVLEAYHHGTFARKEAWLDRPPTLEGSLPPDGAARARSNIPFEPFAQRLEIPPGTRVFLHGDLHGDIHALIAFLDLLHRQGDLDGFRLTRPDVRILFLGDYTDRGRHGVEVLYTLLRLKLANPDRVVLVRGNHEDLTLVAQYGFLAEIEGKYGRAFDARRLVRFFDFLPVVLYLAGGGDVVQCNHGGLEPGYDPGRLLTAPPDVHFQLLGRLEQRRFLTGNADWIATLPNRTRRQLETSLADFVPLSPTAPTVLGFMWNDFTVVPGDPQFAIDPGRAFVHGDLFTRRVLDQASRPERRVRAVVRAHQHAAVLNPLMRRLLASRGIFRHWQPGDGPETLEASPGTLQGLLELGEERAIPDGSVWTFNVSPDSVYGLGCGFTFGTAGELVTGADWASWRLRVLNYAVPTLR